MNEASQRIAGTSGGHSGGYQPPTHESLSKKYDPSDSTKRKGLYNLGDETTVDFGNGLFFYRDHEEFHLSKREFLHCLQLGIELGYFNSLSPGYIPQDSKGSHIDLRI